MLEACFKKVVENHLRLDAVGIFASLDAVGGDHVMCYSIMMYMHDFGCKDTELFPNKLSLSQKNIEITTKINGSNRR